MWKISPIPCSAHNRKKESNVWGQLPFLPSLRTLRFTSGHDTYFWLNLPLWKVCWAIYFPRQKIYFPKLKEANFLFAIITNKLWEPVSSKSTSSRSYFLWRWCKELEQVIIIQKGTSHSRRIMLSKATNTSHTYY